MMYWLIISFLTVVAINALIATFFSLADRIEESWKWIAIINGAFAIWFMSLVKVANITITVGMVK